MSSKPSPDAGAAPAHHPTPRGPEMGLRGRRILLIVTGSIAAYKAALLLRLLRGEGAETRVIMTRSASRFVGEATFSGLSGAPVLTDMFAEGLAGELHVELAAWAELLLVVPTTADVMARAAAGRSDDLATATLLCARCPVLMAPAMHPAMWSHPAVKRNAETLRADARVALVGPVDGEVASGESGLGRMQEPEQILDAARDALSGGDLAGRHLVISAGPTVEDIDPVRFISNRSSGKMGFALAARASARGASVTLVTGPVRLPTPPGVERVDVRSALEMQAALSAALGSRLDAADALIMTAAVGDYRVAEPRDRKLKRREESKKAGSAGLSLELVENPDLLGDVGARRQGSRPVLMGFAVETGSDEEVIAYARGKIESKGVDVVVANHAAESMGLDENRATLVSREAAQRFPTMAKSALADELLSWLTQRLAETPA